MKKYFLSAILASTISITVGFIFAPIASAHEHDVFKIGDSYYMLTVGSLSEPLIVDDLSGVDFRAAKLSGPSATTGAPVTGLESTLKVELSAGDKTEVLPLDPGDTPGTYQANFIPTVETTYSYRIFGTVNGVAVNLTFSCVPGEPSEDAIDSSHVDISSDVSRVNKVGAFGCPEARDAVGFPEPAHSSVELNQAIQDAHAESQTAKDFGIVGLALGALALGTAFSRRRK